ncbi:acyl-CoA dehydrogenase [Mycolicibacterium flavescens]|uniref:Acyl-CoA dehydrogenase n=1 Tax=Mycolicibacterium flavescens TaxID=1776 RepID=A0A1E3R752_MYCFV|nr:acyl-CoA dehydrogenase family protein [Mycolicibacterium flavescens]MCV7278892.1 acyl-CoA dehydrogenase [Mycolicibacterium flavescens]ODQ85768.1 acyl-CoA dehydrogenase [Mycolicibacterium flavescens]
MSALSGGVFATDVADDYADLRQLVDDIGRRSFEARIGVRRIPDQFDEKLWGNLSDTGLTQLSSDAGPNELAVVLAGVARYAGAVPLAETDTLASWLARQAGVEVPDGPLTVAFADDSDATGVPWTRASAAVLLVVQAQGETRVGVVKPADIVDGHNAAGEPRDRVTLDLASAALTAVDPGVVAELVMRGAWCRTVQIVGALDAAAAMTVSHTAEREQFGRSLSKFQSVQHALAGMAGEIERARAAASLAVAAAADHGFDSPQTEFAVTAARVAVGRAVTPVTTIAHQLHGAIGVTAEHPLWWVTLRAQAWANEFGTTAGYARRLGRMALDSANPWDLVIGNL